MMWGKRLERRHGFSIVEAMAIMGVTAILLSVGFSVYTGARQAARVALAESNLRQISVGLELYYRRNGAYPPVRSDLVEELKPFLPDSSVFINPLIPETVPGETINRLYFPPTLDEADSGTHYVTAFVSDDGHTAVVLNTGWSIERPEGISFDHTSAGSVIHAITGETVISGIVNVDPRNNPDSVLTLCLPSGRVITRSEIQSSRGELGFSGAAVWVRFGPKGEGDQNGIKVNGVPYPLYNSTNYTINASTSGRMQVRVWNEDPVTETTKKKVKTSVEMGDWYFDVLAIGGRIEANK